MTNSRLTPVTVPIRLKSGRVTQGTRLMNLIPKAAAGAPSAGPVAAVEVMPVSGIVPVLNDPDEGYDVKDNRLEEMFSDYLPHDLSFHRTGDEMEPHVFQLKAPSLGRKCE